jgi:hypothetical protein
MGWQLLADSRLIREQLTARLARTEDTGVKMPGGCQI